MKRTYRNSVRNYYAIKNANGIHYFIIIGDKHIEVKRPVYKAYSASVRKEMYFDEQYDTILVPLSEMITLVSPSAEADTLHRVALQTLRHAFSQLEKSEQHFLLLYYVCGKSFREIADILNIHFTTVGYRHKNILKKLRSSFLQNACSSDS